MNVQRAEFIAVKGRPHGGWLARVALGICFVYLGLNKALSPTDFLKAVHQYDSLKNTLYLTWIAALLPWFEVFCGVALLVGFWIRGAAFGTFGMLLFFSAMVLQRALQIRGATGVGFCEIRFDCGCGNGEVLVCLKLMENAVLIFLAGMLSLRRFAVF
jgi:uncharacterized membrane protein YphA (DoxX/SURF4 family)